jgi:uncharacterized protein (UPF0335 family)
MKGDQITKEDEKKRDEEEGICNSYIEQAGVAVTV